MASPQPHELPVYINNRAERDIDETYKWLNARSPQGAAKWLNGIADAIDSLKLNPERHGLAPDNDAFPITVRQLLYGSGRTKYRILFTVRPTAVHVLHVRHGSRRLLTEDDIID